MYHAKGGINMLKIENTEVYGWEAAIRGMRNPKNSWDKSDSVYHCGDSVDDFECDLWGRTVRILYRAGFKRLCVHRRNGLH